METYESYPAGHVCLCNIFNIAVLLLGAYILSGFGLLIVVLYLAYGVFMEFMIMKSGCVSCYYYGKRCYCGKGLLAAKLFKKEDPKKFTEKEFTWLTLLPTFLVGVFPIVGGIILLLQGFSWLLLGLVVVIGIMAFPAQAPLHGWACKHCKQREIGCPACELFAGKTKAGKDKPKK